MPDTVAPADAQRPSLSPAARRFLPWLAALASFIFDQLRHHEGASDAQDTIGQA